MRRFNLDEFIWFILLLLLTTLWGYLIFTGAIYGLVNSSMVKYNYFALFIFAILTIFQLSKIITFPSRVDMSNKFIPLIFTLFMAVGYIALNSISTNNSSLLLSEDEVIFNYTGNYITISNDEKENYDTTKTTNYTLIEELNADSEYIGERISIVGYIDRNSNMPENTFAISRDIISCCLQDLRTISILSKENTSFALEKGSWVKALGTIKFENGNPYLELIELSLIKEPEKKFL